LFAIHFPTRFPPIRALKAQRTLMTDKDKKPKNLLRRVVYGVVVLGIIVGFAVALGVFTLVRGFQAPEWAKQRVLTLANDSLGPSRVEFDRLDLVLPPGSLNIDLTVTGIKLLDKNGELQLALPEVHTQLSRSELIRGRIRPVAISLDNADLYLERDIDGRFNVSFGDETDQNTIAGKDDGDGFQSALDGLFTQPVFSHLLRIESLGALVVLSDVKSRHDRRFSDGRIVITRSNNRINSTVGFKISQNAASDASVTLSWQQEIGDKQAELSAQFAGLSTADLAQEFPALVPIKDITTPISGSVTVNIGVAGQIGDVSGVLDIGAGQILAAAPEKSVSVQSAKVYVSYDSTQKRLNFDQISVESDLVSGFASGKVFLSVGAGRTFGAVIGQVKLNDVILDPKDAYGEPLIFESGALDMRVLVNPLRLDIGQLVLSHEDSKLVLSGSMASGPDGWTNAIDLRLAKISTGTLADIWPRTLKPKTRNWYVTNIHQGQISNVVGALRMQPGQKPKVNIGFDLSGVTARYIKALPVIEGGRGYGVLTNQDLRLVLDAGTVAVPGAGRIDLAGSSVYVPDITVKDAPAEVTLVTESSIRSAVGLLDMPPFEFMTKGGIPLDIAQGTASGKGLVRLPLADKVTVDQVDFVINGVLSDVSSDRLMKKKSLRAGQLKLFADTRGMAISGSALLGKTPVSGTWSQKFGPAHKGVSRVDGTIELSQRFLDEFSISLPKDALTGVGIADMEIELTAGKPPEFRLVSDLNQTAMRLDALGWRKSKKTRGRLEILGRISTPVAISRLELSAAGLKAVGGVALQKNGGLKLARFRSVKLDGWLDIPVDIRPAANNGLQISVGSGSVDFRKSTFGTSGNSNSSNQVNIALDKLILSSGITLTELSGDLATGGGLSGSFSAKVNGGAHIVGTMAPQQNGVAVRFSSDNAGAVMRSAGIFETASGGRLDMVMLPTQEKGAYDGTLKITKTRVKNAPALAALLSAISVIGLVEQLAVEGIPFQEIDAKFRMSPQAIDLHSASAVGASMGITMAGLYDFERSRMDMLGVITPIYALNGLLEQSKIFGGMFGAKKGEGLFSFNYTLKGSVDDPKVGVNPLSILTPGLFREIFKQPIPNSGQ